MSDSVTVGDTDQRQKKTGLLVMGIGLTAMIFDGIDLVVYGATVSTLIRDPEFGLTTATAGAIGGYTLLGMSIGALLAGAVGDFLGRRRLMLFAIFTFSSAMVLCALAPNPTLFGLGRAITGFGIGGLVAGVGPLVAEFAPAGKRNLYNAIVFAGFPVGGILAALLAIVLIGPLGAQNVYWLGAVPLVTLLPFAVWKLPESVAWLVSRGRIDEARAHAGRLGMPVPEEPAPAQPGATQERAGLIGLFAKRWIFSTLLLGMMCACGLLLTHALNTWLPELMRRNGYPATSSIVFLLLLNVGAIVGSLAASRVADRIGGKRVIMITFGIGAVSIIILTLQLPIVLLYVVVALAGMGVIGTQTLVYGFVSNYYEVQNRTAGMAWASGFGRLGSILGPVIGGLLLAAGGDVRIVFYAYAGVGLLGLVMTALVPPSPSKRTVVPVEPVEPQPARS